ncbi:3-hydroxyacyl-CoA dehydrogenase family protein [Amycolatopsis japonica]|uniref:3-hydroxyacyl-CoA dehydrogenase family protein n=1 Tax=Amycolatopsis japonica TaxID=208439 RepID=UPI00366ECA23
MGRGIAQSLALGGWSLDLVDRACSTADVIFEAIPETLSVKHGMWAEISAVAGGETMLATNTSALDIDAIAAAVSAPERFLGIHWYNPAQLVPGVEIVVGRATSPDTVARAFALIAEAFRCLEEGVATAESIDEITRWTFGIRLGDFGPIRLADMGGLDTYVSILTYLTETLGERFAVPAVLREIAERGDVGVKSGQGVFSYADGEGAALVSARDAALVRRLDDGGTP